jgi:myo-inositol-1(or 4)-monophosphatase
MAEIRKHDNDVGLDEETLQALGRTALRLARLAGERISAAYGGGLAVHYKVARPGAASDSNPVSSADTDVEALLRTHLAAEFPNHAVIGEELLVEERRSEFVWVIDPIDGTTNFINGLPLFAASIGVLFKGRPVAGATWCAATQAFRPGVYHGVGGGALHFDGQLLSRRAEQPWRGLAAEPGRAPSYAALWDMRVFGCATLEFAFVAAGLLRIAYIPRPALWDVVAGLALLRSAGCRALVRRTGRWETMLGFESSWNTAKLSEWCEPLLIGAEADLERALSVVPG